MESERTIEVGLAFGEEGLPRVDAYWFQSRQVELEPDQTIEFGLAFGEEGLLTV